MIDQLANLEPFWVWLCVGLILLALEVLIPGVFLMWLGLASIISALASLAFGWQIQAVVFVITSLGFFALSVWLGRRNRDESKTHQSGRFDHFLGVETLLVEAISGGQGRVKLGDTTWRVSGADLPEGAKVRIVSVDHGELCVVPAQDDSQ